MIVIQDKAAAQSSNETETLAYIYNFLLDLLDASPTKYDFIIRVQSLFCPTQPICGNYGNRSHDDIINEIPSLEIHNKTVMARELNHLIGVCCLPCSCDDSCIDNDRCCLTKLAMDLENGGRSTERQPAIKSECIPATSAVYFTESTKISISYLLHPVETKCFPQNGYNATKRYNSTITSCEQPNVHHYVIDEMTPVSSLISGRSYWNKYCAMCNNDSQDIEPWSAMVHVERPYCYFFNKYFQLGTETFASFFKSIIKAGKFVYRKPNKLKYIPCLLTNDGSDCDSRSLSGDNPKERFMRDACSNFSAAVLIRGKIRASPYKNIFCFFCGGDEIIPPGKGSTPDCMFTDIHKNIDAVMTGLLNYRLGHIKDGEGRATTDEQERDTCPCRSTFDRNKVKKKKKKKKKIKNPFMKHI